MSDRDDFEAWLHRGIGNGWVSTPVCVTHDHDKLLSDNEAQQWRDTAEVCVPVVRLHGLEVTL